MYSSTMAVFAALMAAHSIRPVGLGILLVVVLLVGLAAVASFIGREYVKSGRRGSGREQSLQPWFMLGLTIIGLIALVGRYWK